MGGIHRQPHHAALALVTVSLLGCKPSPMPVVPAPPSPVVEPPPPQPPELSQSPSPEPTLEPEPEFQLQGYGTHERGALSGRSMEGQGDGLIRWPRSARLSPNAPAYGNPDAAPFDWGLDAVLVEDGDEPRIAVRQGDVRLLVYVASDDLWPLVVKPFALRSGPGARLRDAKVEVGSGESLTIAQRDGDWVEVHIDHTPFSGWAPAKSIGWFHHDVPIPDDGLDDAEFATIEHDVVLRTKPGGRQQLTKIPTNKGVRIHQRSGSHVLVSYHEVCTPVPLRFTGYVPRGALGPALGGLGSCGSGRSTPPQSFGDERDRPRRWLTPGTLLLDPASNRVVGCAWRDAEVAEGDGDIVFVSTVWGPVPVRPAPANVEERCYADPSAKPKAPQPKPTTAA